MPNLEINDIDDVIAGRGQTILAISIKRDGSAVNLSGKNPVATIRRIMYQSVDSSLEDVALSVTNAVSGIANLTLTDAMLQKMQERRSIQNDAVPYIVQIKIPEDLYYPDPFRIWVRYAPD